ncbi:MAG: metallophosphoesterase [Solirubrobacteraceae bacterium]|nr:MAG: metallophosphoesterase [Solirubrobacterales bacterium]
MRFPRHRVLAGAAVGAGALAYAVLIEPRRLVVREIVLHPPGWPSALDGLRVGVLADIHAGGPGANAARVRHVVARLNAAAPDLVVLPGDFTDPDVLFGEWTEPEPIARALGELRASLGRFAVLGNHDWINHAARLQRALRDAGIEILEDRALALDAPAPLWVAGFGDFRTRAPDPAAALAAVPDDAAVIAVTHDPDLFPRVPSRVALTVAGHLHGGQIAIPLLWRLKTPTLFGGRYRVGVVEELGRLLYVSSGVGQAGLPLRFGMPPEVAVLELRASGP